MSLYDKMGLLITPNGVAPSKIFAYKPTNGSGDGVFDRNTTATRVNSSGLIEDVAIDMARIDYPTNGSCPHLLFEPQSTNLITQSESFGKSYWTKTGASIQGDPSTAGVEEVVNGDFATDTWWGKDTSWTISGGSANSNGSGTMYKGSVLTIGKTYLVSFDISSYTSGSVSYPNGGFTPTLAVGSYSFTYMASSATVSFSGVSFIGSIDNVSVKEVQGFESPSLDSPTGAFKLVEDTINSSHQLISLFSFTSGVSYTFSVFVKKLGSRDSIKIQAGNPATWGAESVFDLSNGTVSSTINGSAEIDGLYNGYYKCTVTGVANVTAGTAIVLRLYNGGTTYTGDGTSGVYIYGAQLEALPYATSYIPTSGSAVTRVKDVATNFGDVNSFNSSEGVLFVEMAALSNDTSFRAMSINDGYTTNRITLVYNGGIRVFNVSGGSVSSNLDYVTTITNTQKIAIVWSSSFFDLWVNGVKRGSGSGVSFSSGTLNTMGFEQGNGGNNMYAKVKQVQVYKEALTDAELITLTASSTYTELAQVNSYNLILDI